VIAAFPMNMKILAMKLANENLARCLI